MSKTYAAGKLAFGFCDRCDQRYELKELKMEYRNLEPANNLVCPECWDGDHPQLQLGRFSFDDPQALRDPRPDQGQQASRFDDTYRWDFEDSVEGWVPANATLVHVPDTDPGELIGPSGISITPTTNDPKLLGLDGQGISASEYGVVRVRIKLVTSPSALMVWSGRFFWTEDLSVVFEDSMSMDVVRPKFETMGDRWHLLEWNVREHSSWAAASTIQRLRFDFVNDTSSVFYIDYITVEKS